MIFRSHPWLRSYLQWLVSEGGRIILYWINGHWLVSHVRMDGPIPMHIAASETGVSGIYFKTWCWKGAYWGGSGYDHISCVIERNAYHRMGPWFNRYLALRSLEEKKKISDTCWPPEHTERKLHLRTLWDKVCLYARDKTVPPPQIQPSRHVDLEASAWIEENTLFSF